MSTPKKAAAAVVDLVNRVGIEEATALMVKLAAEREAALSTPTTEERCPKCHIAYECGCDCTPTTEEARELAKRWAHKCDGPLSGSTFRACECWQTLDATAEARLYAGVLDLVKSTWTRTMADEGSAAPPDRILSPALGITMAEARDLFDAAKAANPGWPS